MFHHIHFRNIFSGPRMRLKELLFQHNLKQSDLWRAAIRAGGTLDQGGLCGIINNKRTTTDSNRKAIRLGLTKLGIPKEEWEGIEELIETPKGLGRPPMERCHTCHQILRQAQKDG